MNSSEPEVLETVVALRRVAKVVKGGRRFGFSALVVVGDKNGHVGVGLGKAREVPEAIRKGSAKAKRNMITVCMKKHTIPHEMTVRYKGGKVIIKPASPGTGVIAGGATRAVLEYSGIHDVLAKNLGSSNPINCAKATILALKQLRDARTIADLRNKKISEIFQ